jgi:hypothetical protein
VEQFRSYIRIAPGHDAVSANVLDDVMTVHNHSRKCERGAFRRSSFQQRRCLVPKRNGEPIELEVFAFTTTTPNVLVATIYLVARQEPEAGGDLRRIEQLAGQRDHAVDYVGLDHHLADSPSPDCVDDMDPLASTTRRCQSGSGDADV